MFHITGVIYTISKSSQSTNVNEKNYKRSLQISVVYIQIDGQSVISFA